MLAIQEVDRVATLRLQDRADASTALATHELLLRVDLANIDSVEVDASAVVKLDAAMLQLLVAWSNVLESHHIPWRWSGASAAFSQAAAIAGLSHVLRLANGRSDDEYVV